MEEFIEEKHPSDKPSNDYHIKDTTITQSLEVYLKEILQIFEEQNTIFARRTRVSLLHNDSSRENVFYSTGNVRLIDWEFAGYGLPETELVYFIDSYDLTTTQISLLLNIYGYPRTALARRKLNISYLMLLCSSVGYSLWRIDGTIAQKEKREILARLARDINRIKQVLKDYAKV